MERRENVCVYTHTHTHTHTYIYITSLYNRYIDTKPDYWLGKSPSKKKKVPTDSKIRVLSSSEKTS